MRKFDARLWTGGWALLACLFAGAMYAMQKGQDAAWDLKNYHLYNAWAFLHDRSSDLTAAGLQGFFNPLLDVPYFWLGTGWLHGCPRLLSGFQGLWYGATVFVVLRIAARFAEMRGRPFGYVDLLAVAVGITGTMVVSQTGSSTNEVPLALLVMLGFYVLLPIAAPATFGALRRAFAAGLLCGLAAGLKPTAVVYTPALGAALWLACGGRMAAFKACTVFVSAAFFAFLLAYGWWGWRLYQLTGNPVFPLFNQVFHSSWVAAVGGTDRQFMPKDLGQWLFYPFYWMHRNAYQGGNTFADSRYAVAMIGAAMLAVTVCTRRARQAAGAPSVRFLLLFVVFSYLLWLNLYSILRYAVSIEVLTGFVILFALQEALAAARGTEPKLCVIWAMSALTVLMLAFTRYTDWGHAPYAAVAFDVQPPQIAPGATVLILGQPNAYVAPFFASAASIRFIGITWLNNGAERFHLGELTRELVTGHAGPLYAITRDANGQDQAQLLRILPSSHLSDCQPIETAMERTLRGTDLSDGLRLCQVTQI